MSDRPVIDLAPGHKVGMVVANPVLLGAGSIGLGDARHPELETSSLGAVVVGPVSRQSRAGSPPPRYAPLPGGMVLGTGAQNRGLDATLRKVAPQWARLGAPVVVQIAEWGESALRMVLRLAEVDGVAAMELLLPGSEPAAVRRSIAPLAEACDLPIWAKLAHAPEQELCAAAEAAVLAGAAALVVAQPPQGAAMAHGALVQGALVQGDLVHGDLVHGDLVHGELYGPALFAQTLALLHAVAARVLPVPLIASGGIFGEAQVRAALAAGAAAVQLDAVAWIEPTLPAQIARALVAG
jgi:dihydroorotate dehydrogenase